MNITIFPLAREKHTEGRGGRTGRPISSRRGWLNVPCLLLIFACFTILLTSTKCYGQEIIYNADGTVALRFKTVQEWEKYRDKIVLRLDDAETSDSLIRFVYKPAILKQTEIIKQLDSGAAYLKKISIACEEQKTLLLGELIDLQTIRKPAVEWLGFYAGLNTGYYFTDSVMTQETITGAIWNNLCIQTRALIRIREFILTPGFVIPLAKERKAGITIEIGYRIF